MRAGVKALCCAAALFALLAAAARADDYNKMMTFTFQNSVQLPGATLEPGTYMFKLADPESGRRTVQVWNKDGSKLLATALTIVDRRAEIAADPTKIKDGLVMFSETPAGVPQAIRSWFYTGDTIGYDFVYPKNQAEQIAKAYHTSVLATNDGSSDAAALKSAKVGRIDENGQFNDDNAALASNANAAKDSTASTTATSSTSTTTASTSSTTAPAAAATTTAPRQTASNVDQEPRPVGTTGQSAATQTTTAPQSTTTGSTNAALPKTASPLATLELMSMLSFGLALGVRRYRQGRAEL